MSVRDKPIVSTALAVQRRFGEDRAGDLAASMSYYAFLSLFPLLLLAMSVVGFVLAGDPAAQRDWAGRLSEAVPGLQPIIGDNIQALVDARGATGALGLVGLLWSGTSLAEAGANALSRVFGFVPMRGFARRKAWALGVTVALGLLALVGFGVAGAATNLPVSGAAAVAAGVGGAVLTLTLDFALFGAAFMVLAQGRGPRFRRIWRGALLAALGWTVLKLVGSWYAVRTVSGSTEVYGTFAATVGILVLLHLASQMFLYGAELNAVTGVEEDPRGKAEERLAA